jgi:23S rRNA (adenine2503-C2)-methyltransferase
MTIEVIAQAGNEEIATVYVAKTASGTLVEFVESIQPPYPRSEKWVLIVSPLLGCPVGCPMCDAGGWYQGKLANEDILAQIDYMVNRRYPDKKITSKKFKIQFARMGEPAFNHAVLKTLSALPQRYDAPGLLPSISTVAPKGCNDFFTQLIAIKNSYYANGHFQLQFSIHTTDSELRDKIIPIKKWGFDEIAAYGEKFTTTQDNDRKITLNFALAKGNPLDAKVLKNYFDPNKFFIKLTPLNPTLNAQAHNLESHIDPNATEKNEQLVEELTTAGYEVLLSIGELEENKIGSNCGQYIKRFLDGATAIKDSYQYELQKINAN